ncbi:S8 family serine peptidase [Alphaproteobacteria bacterium]|nr:S8 family serine peptidase [Alphaproteobacteria bacterium]
MKLTKILSKTLTSLVITTILASCSGGGGMGDFSTIHNNENRTVQIPNPTTNFDLTENTTKGSYDSSNYNDSDYNDFSITMDGESKSKYNGGYVDSVTITGNFAHIEPKHLDDTGIKNQWAKGWTGQGTTINIIDDVNNKNPIVLDPSLQTIRTGEVSHWGGGTSTSTHQINYKVTTNMSHGDVVASIAGGDKKNITHNVKYEAVGHTLKSCDYKDSTGNNPYNLKSNGWCLGWHWQPKSSSSYLNTYDGFNDFEKNQTLFQAPGVAKDASITKSHIDLSGRVSFAETIETLYGHIENSTDFDAVNLSIGITIGGITYNDLVNYSEEWNLANPKGVYVIAAGNSGAPCTEANFGNCNLLAVDLMLDPTLGDQVIIAGATTTSTGVQDGIPYTNKSKATYSNSAGVTKDRYLMAEGDCGYANVKGTSCAAPRITGGAAVLKSKFPNLTGEHASDILLLTADKDINDDGADDFSGVSSTFGHGEMDLNKALNPVGTLEIAQASNDNETITKQEITNTQLQLSSVFDLSANSTSAVVGLLDSYDRVYPVSMQHFIHNQNAQIGITDFIKERNGTSASKVSVPEYLNFVDVLNNNTNEDFSVENRTYGFFDNPYNNIISQGGETYDLAFDHKHSSTKISVSKSNPLNFSAEEQFIIKSDTTELGFNLGLASEKNTFLGSQGFGALAQKDHTTTLYGDVNFAKNLSNNTKIVSNLSIGQTNLEFENEGFVSASPIITNAINFGMINYDAERQIKTAFVLDTPLKVVDGQLNLNTISGYTAVGDYRNDSQTIDLDNGNRDLNLSIYFDKEIDDNKNFGLKATVSDSGAISGAAFFKIKF